MAGRDLGVVVSVMMYLICHREQGTLQLTTPHNDSHWLGTTHSGLTAHPTDASIDDSVCSQCAPSSPSDTLKTLYRSSKVQHAR